MTAPGALVPDLSERASLSGGARVAVTATAALGPWGKGIALLERFLHGEPALTEHVSPPVPGFLGARFHPAVHECLLDLAATGALRDPARTAVVLAGGVGDAWTLDTTSEAVIAGRKPNPLLFYQSVPIAVLGVSAQQLGIRGGLVSVSGTPDPFPESVELAATLLASREARQVVVMFVASPASERARAVYRCLNEGEGVGDAADWALALLLELEDEAEPSALPLEVGARTNEASNEVAIDLARLPPEVRTAARVCIAAERLRRADLPRAVPADAAFSRRAARA